MRTVPAKTKLLHVRGVHRLTGHSPEVLMLLHAPKLLARFDDCVEKVKAILTKELRGQPENDGEFQFVPGDRAVDLLDSEEYASLVKRLYNLYRVYRRRW